MHHPRNVLLLPSASQYRKPQPKSETSWNNDTLGGIFPYLCEFGSPCELSILEGKICLQKQSTSKEGEESFAIERRRKVKTVPIGIASISSPRLMGGSKA